MNTDRQAGAAVGTYAYGERVPVLVNEPLKAEMKMRTVTRVE